MSMKNKIVTYALGTVVVAVVGLGYFGGKHVLAEKPRCGLVHGHFLIVC